MARPWPSVFMMLLPILALITSVFAADQYVQYTDESGQTVLLNDKRRPALYTEDFASCLPSSQSLITVSRFDAQLYNDNMTVGFHIAGTTNLKKESVMVYIGVYAYGETRFELSWNPCYTDMHSLCPANASVPIEVSGYIPLGQQDLANVPSIAFNIPDFEGQAILRIFANSTQSEIACYTAAVTNGNTFNQAESVGSILGIFTVVALVSSVATAIYGETVSEMRTHHAHSLSVLVVFAVFQHIYFTGALSMNWPSILVAFWANFAWSGGMIYAAGIEDSLSKLAGKFSGNTLAVGAARAGADSSNVGGGFNIHKIYKRTEFSTAKFMGRWTRPVNYQSGIAKRSLLNSTNGFEWYGGQARTGLPLPGNYSGFAGTLSLQGIPAANAFLTGLIWFLILILILAGSFTIFKFTLELLYKVKLMKTQRLNYFRRNWTRYLVAVLLKACYIAFFMMMFLAIFQFTYSGAPAAIAIAGIVFAMFFIGILGVCGLACYFRMRVGKWHSEPDRIFLERRKVLGFLPWFHFHQGYKVHNSEKIFAGSLPGWRISRDPEANEIAVHEDESYLQAFGWLSARYRLSKWWFFVLWTVYELIRACFYAGASGHALIQVYGLLVVEIVAFFVIVAIKPYEGQRLNVVMVYLLGFSKVLTVALSSAFDISFRIERIPATIIGVLIIIIQGCLTIALLICIVLSAITSYFSITRNRAEIKPRKWMPHREKYFKHIHQRATDKPMEKPIPAPVPEEPLTPKDPYFSVNTVRRMAKIEDEDQEFQKDIATDPREMEMDGPFSEMEIGAVYPSAAHGLSRRGSVAQSIASNVSHSSLPNGAYLHRGSWSRKDLPSYYQEGDESHDRLHSTTSELLADARHSPTKATRSPFLSNRSSRDSITFSRSPSTSKPMPFPIYHTQPSSSDTPTPDELPSSTHPSPAITQNEWSGLTLGDNTNNQQPPGTPTHAPYGISPPPPEMAARNAQRPLRSMSAGSSHRAGLLQRSNGSGSLRMTPGRSQGHFPSPSQ